MGVLCVRRFAVGSLAQQLALPENILRIATRVEIDAAAGKVIGAGIIIEEIEVVSVSADAAEVLEEHRRGRGSCYEPKDEQTGVDGKVRVLDHRDVEKKFGRYGEVD